MKNIAVAALLSLTIVACKKETKTVTKVDPKTGKTVTVEVPVEETKETEPENLAIKDSAGIFKQTFNLEKGKTYPLTTYQRDTKTLTAPDGKTMNGTSESTDEMTFTVNDIKGNVYDMTINLIGKRSSQSAEGKTLIVDTKMAMPKDDNLKLLWNVTALLSEINCK